ncbi:TonB-dependent receptor [Pseudoxanthomonas broegbernensis]|uniref:TonB-dependent receptor n=1 Tax=Pseudoxanthomonas broegbernensis TaxID=83619 RepID=A0A7V8GLK3_9GAMM|nr:TonB-dependent receptor [Pseudoxanthomonas broegbernensis]KAF1685905.1 TonB-dependent receptor [Pseudoxanthomonas broegbernensis]MBB6064133.1 outer membrane receptor protein involved in Fe transport [Pseudoxanthomonas broegbernensis]
MACGTLQQTGLAIAVIAALSSLAATPAAHAQEQSQAQDAQADKPVTLSGLTVTAQKREQALQEVPIVVNVLGEQLLQDTGVRDIKDLQVLVPGLTVTSTQSAAQTTARIRGIGTVGDNAGLESSVGVVIDGVYRPRNSVGFTDLGELERIEVLKGPQGTVFGKNTSAGVINVVTRKPSYTQSAEAEITVGNHGAIGASGAYNDALGENSAVRIYAAKRKRDGVDAVRTGAGPRTGTDDGDQNFHTLRGQLLWEPSADVEVNLSADFTSREENCCVTVTTHRGPTAAIIDALAGGEGVIPAPDPERRLAYANRSTEQDIKDKGVQAEVNWNTPWASEAVLTSITAWRDWQAINGLDFDYSAADVLYRAPDEDESLTKFSTFSQELRLTGSSERVDWMVGVFYSDEDLDRNESYRYGAAYEPYLSTLVGSQVLAGVAAQLAPLGLSVNQAGPATFLSQVSGQPFGSNYTGLGALDRHEQNARSAAIFTNNTWHATDALDLTVGLRYTHEKKELRSAYTNPNGSAACAATLANPAARVGGALAQRINGFASLPPALQQQLLGALVPAVAPSIAGYMCLPWANIAHHGRNVDQSRTEKEWSGTLKLAYNWSGDVMTYVSAARGYKAGGFNLDRVQSSNGLSSGTQGIAPVDDTSFPGEFVDSYEIGAKTTWADGNLLLNAALFHQTYENFQLNSFLGTSFVVRSIPEVVSKGVDAELMWQTGVDGLSLQGGFTYAETEYGDDPLPDADLALLPGNQMSFAPKWSGNASVTYRWDIGGSLQGRFNIGAKYMSDYNTGSDLDPQKAQDAYTLVNARLGIGARDQRWMLEFWGQNLTDETYKQVGIDAPIQAGSWNAFLGAPRLYGMTLRVRY